MKTDVKAVSASVATVNTSATKMAPRNVFKIDEPKDRIDKIEEIKIEDEISTNDSHLIDHFGDDDDIDFSVIEDNEVKAEVAVKTEPQPTIKTESPKAAKSSDIFENIRPNWDSAFNMEDDDDADLLSAIVDEEMMMGDGKQMDMKFWYWDAWEDANNPGQIFLFGKIAVDNKNPRSTEYKSICVKVENVEHCIYVLPREFVCSVCSQQSSGSLTVFFSLFKSIRFWTLTQSVPQRYALQ